MSCWSLQWLPIIISVLALGVSSATLCYLIRYTTLTKGIEEAAREQAEASQKPVVVMAFEYREDEADAIWEKVEAESVVPHATMLKLSQNSRNFLIHNIGTGPALNLTFDFIPVKSDPTPHQPFFARKLSYLLADQVTESTIGPGHVPASDFRFRAHYESLSGKLYSTEMLLHVRKSDTIVLQGNWIFTKVDPG